MLLRTLAGAVLFCLGKLLLGQIVMARPGQDPDLLLLQITVPLETQETSRALAVVDLQFSACSAGLRRWATSLCLLCLPTASLS